MYLSIYLIFRDDIEICWLIWEATGCPIEVKCPKVTTLKTYFTLRESSVRIM